MQQKATPICHSTINKSEIENVTIVDTSIPTTDSKSLDNEGNNLLSQGKYEQAIPYFDRILAMNSCDSGLLVEASKNKQLAIDTRLIICQIINLVTK